ncbi:MAG: VWA domain-containing protein [Verrucomicrobiota bacterium]
MSFAYPLVLFLLAVPLVLIVLLWRGHTRAVALPFDYGHTQHSSWGAGLLNVVNSLPPLLLACVILIVAGPRKFETPKAKRKMTNIMFVLDVSGSMTADFGGQDRYAVAMESLNEFLTYRKGDSFSLMVFGDDNLRWIPLTSDVSAFRCAPPFLHPSSLPGWFSGGTSIGKALSQARKYLVTAEEGDRMIVLLSDGQSFDLSDGNDSKVANELEDEGISVYTIHIGAGGAPDEVAVISSITGGQTFAAGDPQALDVIFRRIDEMAQAPMERLTPEPVDNFRPYLLAALGIGGVYLMTLFGLRYTPW